MNLLSVENLSHSFGAKVLFENISFGISQGEKVGLIAGNGSGKTTLMRILAGEESAESGKCVFRKGVRTGYLPQDPVLDADKTVLEFLLSADTLQNKAVRNYEKALLKPEDEAGLQSAMAEMDKQEGWNLDSELRRMLDMVKIEDHWQICGTLSAGQKKRVALASLLLLEPEILFLDEVTNHLDTQMIEWLEGVLSSSRLSLLMITHDRYFLDQVCGRIIELDNKTIYTYKGGYSYYLEKKSQQEESDLSHTMKMRNVMRRELEWMRRQPKARGTKSKSRVDAFGAIAEEAKLKHKATLKTIDLKVERLGGKIIEMHHLKKNFGERKIISNFSYAFKAGDKIGVVGRNGAGKSTLIKIITGAEGIDGGKVVIGDTVKIGYFGQESELVDDTRKVIDVVRDVAEFIPINKGRTLTAEQLLENFMFPRRQQHDYAYKLSGGERRRLQLLTVLMSNPNLLILDEPTNDLDIMTLGVLEDYLEGFPGCLLVVSHDRFFLDKLCQHLFVFTGDGNIRDYYGTYSEYKQEQSEISNQTEEQKNRTEVASKDAEKSTDSAKRKLIYKEQREYNTLEKDIAKLEIQKAKLTEEIASNPNDFATVESASKKLGEIIDSLEQKEARWLELSELV